MGFEHNAAAILLLALFLSFNIFFVSLASAFGTSDISNIIPTTAPGSFNNNIAPTTTTSGYIAPTASTSYRGGCPRDALQLGICANVLNLVDVDIGSPPTLPCCGLIQGLVDLEAAVCLCTAIRANILGINLNVPISLSLVLNNCGRNVPNGFECN